MAGLLAALTPKVAEAAASATASATAAIDSMTPKAEFSMGDIFDEVRSLREENASLRSQIAILSALPDGSADGQTPAQRVKAARTAEELEAERSVILRCFVDETAQLEGAIEHVRLQGAVEREELAMRCDELGRALEQRVLQAEQTQHDAAAAARQQSAETIAALEEQLGTMADDAARRDALTDAYGADVELAEAEARTVEATTRAAAREAEASALREKLQAQQHGFDAELRRAELRVDSAVAEASAAHDALTRSQGSVEQLQAQLVRLSDGFNKQVRERAHAHDRAPTRPRTRTHTRTHTRTSRPRVRLTGCGLLATHSSLMGGSSSQVEEVLAMQKRLRDTETSHVEKAVARSWVVNYVEAGGGPHGEELLRLMAEWWEFTPMDQLRVGLSEMPHPSREALLTPLEPSLTAAFASFLDERSESDHGEAAIPGVDGTRPPPRSPSARAKEG
jgi:hypothetical protein